LPIRAVVFDVDGTWLDSFPIGLKAAKGMYRDIGKRFRKQDEKIIRDRWGEPLSRIVGALFADATRAERNRAFTLLLNRIIKLETESPPKLIPGTNAAFKTLKIDMRLTVAIATNRSAEKLYEVLLRTAFRIKFVDFIIAHSTSRSFAEFLKQRTDKPIFVSTPYRKPDRRYLIKLNRFLNSKGIMPHEVVFCGDALPDAETAKAGGYNFLPVLTGPANNSTAWWEAKSAELKIPLFAIASSIKDVPMLIKTLNKVNSTEDETPD